MSQGRNYIEANEANASCKTFQEKKMEQKVVLISNSRKVSCKKQDVLFTLWCIPWMFFVIRVSSFILVFRVDIKEYKTVCFIVNKTR